MSHFQFSHCQRLRRTVSALAFAAMVLSLACGSGSHVEPRPIAVAVEALPPPTGPNPKDSSGAVGSAAEDRAHTQETPDEIVYRVELEDAAFSRSERVRHLTWTCTAGTCLAKGRPLNIGVKSCVSFGAALGVQVAAFHYGDQSLPPEALERCRSYLTKLKDSGKFDEIRRRHQLATRQPDSLGPNQAYLEITAFDGQMRLRDGSLRFVFVTGEVALLTPSGEVFRFDGERRLIDSGRFVRWQSVRGYYASSLVNDSALTERCSRTNGGTVLVPWEIRRSSSQIPACHPHHEDFRLVFERGPLTQEQLRFAEGTLFQAAYGRDRDWSRLAAPKGAPRVFQTVVGSAQSEPGYHAAPARDMLEKVHLIVASCASALAPKLLEVEGKGELLLLLNALGKPKTAMVRRTTFAEPERLSACIEQRSMGEVYQSTFDVLLRVPFDIKRVPERPIEH